MNTLHHLPVQAGFVFISIFAGLTVISLLTHFIARRYGMPPCANFKHGFPLGGS